MPSRQLCDECLAIARDKGNKDEIAIALFGMTIIADRRDVPTVGKRQMS
jgi:hypothetical protein